MDLKEYIQIKRAVLEPFILDFLKQKKETSESVPFLTDAIAKLEEFVTNGKMLRGILSLSSFEMFGEKIGEAELSLAASLELTHSALLIHDDIMDRDLKRRGKPTLFAQYIQDASKENIRDTKLYGISQAICVGDIALFFAHELISKASADYKLQSFYSEELVKVGAAQMQDVAFGYSDDNPTIEKILEVYTYKSGRYTFSLPLVSGALMAEKTDEIIHQLDQFGEKLGVIFQIKDDEIGLFGNEKEIGKPVGSDIRENKKTIFRALLFQKASIGEKDTLSHIFGNEKITTKEIEEVKELIKTLEIFDEINITVEKLLKEVREILAHMDIDSQYKKLLNDFVEYNLKRAA